MERRKNIALFISENGNEISDAVCEGAHLAAKEIDANLFILPVGIVDGNYHDVGITSINAYRYQYNTLYSCAKFEGIDAIVMEYGTVTSHIDEEHKKQFLKQFGDVPVILLAGEAEGYSSFRTDNSIGLRNAIEHLIDVHHCNKIGFVSGPADTNQDANDRLVTFRETLKDKGLVVDDDWIVYGDFSPYTRDIVKQLLTKHPDMEAIVFANDKMAIGGYGAIKQMGLEVGKDILVTGFDDSSCAMLLEPHLTTVKADAKELAYRAVLECFKIATGKEVHQTVGARLMVRESCGCIKSDDINEIAENAFADFAENRIKQLAEQVLHTYVKNYFENSKLEYAKGLIENYFAYYFHLVDDGGLLHLHEETFVEEYMEFAQLHMNGYIELKDFLSVGYMLHGYLGRMIKSEKDRLSLLQAMSYANQELMKEIAQQELVTNEKNILFGNVLSNIMRDMLQFSNEERKKYETVIDKLRKMEFSSGYIYTYEQEIEHSNNEDWRAPEWSYVNAYYKGDEIHLYKEKEKKIKTNSIFVTEWMPQERRYDMLVMPLFSKERQYGFLITESETEYLAQAAQIAFQLGASIDMLETLKKQKAIKEELESNLAQIAEKNKVLDMMSRFDPLTGILNRRGFFDLVKQHIDDEKNYGRTAIAIYADMDNLKIVNDEFGHEEGDYSIKLIAKALSEALSESDVVARMGGDEFAAFAMVEKNYSIQAIKERVYSTLSKLNVGNGKKYYVNMSVGIEEFTIKEDINIEHILTEADKKLYVEKKGKKKVVYKN